MKRLIITALLLIFTAGGCVSLGKHEDLKNRYDALEKQSALLQQKERNLESENSQLRGKNEKLAAEIDQLKKGAEIHYEKGREFYRLEQYESALDEFGKIMDRYPADPLAVVAGQKIAEINALSAGNYSRTVKALEGIKEIRAKIDFLEKETGDRFFTVSDLSKLLRKKETLQSEFKMQEDVNKHILVEDDPTQSVRFYRSTHPIVQNVGQDKSFYIELYIAQHYTGKKDLRLKTQYIGNRWISYDSVIIKGENSQIEVICKYPDKLSNMMNERIYEWADSDIDDDKIIKLSKSSPITIRFNGGYKYTFTLDDEQLLGIREIVKKYLSIK
jgi:cell division protein FtsB